MIYLVQPQPGTSVSGGYRFNREIVDRLERDRLGTSVSLDAVATDASEQRFRADTLVFDSLYLSRQPPERRSFDTRLCLLCHFLPSRQPHLDAVQRQALVETELAWLQRMDRVLVPSYRFENKIRRMMPRSTEIHVVTPGLSRAFSRPPTPPRRPLVGREIRIVTVDALTEAKSVLAILEGLESIEPSSVSWDIAGDLEREPRYRERFLHDLAGSRFASRVTVHGALPQSAVVNLLDRADLYVTASREESYGMATAEAVARGLPVIGFDVGCASKWIISGVNGWLIGQHHAAELGAVLTRVLDDRELLGTLSEGAEDARGRIQFPSWADTYRDFTRALTTDLSGRNQAASSSGRRPARGTFTTREPSEPNLPETTGPRRRS